MQIQAQKREIAKQLQSKINAMQGLGKPVLGLEKSKLLPFNRAFPDQVFPIGAIHEFTSHAPTDAASTTAFIASLTGKILKDGGLCFWVGADKKIFPSALKHFGLQPDRIVFINAKPKDALWIIEEAMKCEALSAVIGEVKELNFTESRRLQLAVERSGVTGFIHRINPRGKNAIACTARWQIIPLPSVADDDLPGIGYSCWDVQLLKAKNGRPAAWQVRWSNNSFEQITEKRHIIPLIERHAG